MDYIPILKDYGVPVAIGIIGWIAGRNKNKAETNKLQAETDFLYSQKYKEDIEATIAFRELLVSENAALVKEIKDMKLKYEITTISLKEQISLLNVQLEEIIADREYEKCKGTLCNTRMEYEKIMESRKKRRDKKLAKLKIE